MEKKKKKLKINFYWILLYKTLIGFFFLNNYTKNISIDSLLVFTRQVN